MGLTIPLDSNVPLSKLLSDPYPIITYPCHLLPNCCLVDLIDVTLACEVANQKLVDVVTVADVDDEDRVG